MEWWSLGSDTITYIVLAYVVGAASAIFIFTETLSGWSKRFRCEARDDRRAEAYSCTSSESDKRNEADEPFSPAYLYFRTTYQLFCISCANSCFSTERNPAF